jgi:hypothetical protein
MREPPHDRTSSAYNDEDERKPGQDQTVHSHEDLTVEGLVRFANSELVAGVDRNVLEEFLIMIRDHYPQADKATVFIEYTTGNVNVSGIKNVRGILSHLVMLLDAESTPEKKREQLVNAEGHLRRAIAEPYEFVLDELTLVFADVYERYKKDVLPISDEHGSLRKAPKAALVNIRLEEIRDLGAKGKEAKDKSLKDPEWQSGVSCLISAFEKLTNLKDELDGYCNTFDNMIEENERQEKLRNEMKDEARKSTRFHITAITIGVLGIIIAILLVVIPGLADGIRKLFSH